MRKPTTREQRRRRRRRKRIAQTAAAGIAVAALVAGIVCFAVSLTEQRRAQEEAERAQEQAASQGEQTDGGSGEEVGFTEEELAELGSFAATAHVELPADSPSITPEEATDVSILIDKSEHLLTLYNNSEEIARYTVGLAQNKDLAAKQKVGDNCTPEGEFYICVRNDKSKYYLALGLSYPNAEDAARGLSAGLISQAEYDEIVYAIENGQQPPWDTQLGGQIMIHGQKGILGGQCDWTTGCVAVNNDVMDILWEYCPTGTPVTITA